MLEVIKLNTKKEFLNIPMSMLKIGLSSSALLLYGLLYKMSYTGWEGCYPTNKTLANTLGLTPRSINLLLNELLEHKCISIRYDEENKNLRWIKCLISNEVPIASSRAVKNNPIDQPNGGFRSLNDLDAPNGGFNIL